MPVWDRGLLQNRMCKSVGLQEHSSQEQSLAGQQSLVIGDRIIGDRIFGMCGAMPAA